MTTPKPRLDIFNDSPRLLSKKCRTSTPTLRPPKPPMKSTKNIRRQRGYYEHQRLNQTVDPDTYFYQANVSSESPTTTPVVKTSNNSTTTATSMVKNNDDFFTETSFNLHEGSFSFNLLGDGHSIHGFDHEKDRHCRLFRQFDVISKIGSGDFADVYEVKSRQDGRYYAIKRSTMPFTSNADRLRKLQEVRNHQLLPSHPNCVRYYDSWEEDGYLYIQTELCRTSLNGILENSDEHKLPEQLIWGYLLDLLAAVKHLHDNDLIHMDIKPDNIFISFDGVAKLGDFGLMCSSSDLNSSILSTISEAFPRRTSSFNNNYATNNNNNSSLNNNNNNDHLNNNNNTVNNQSDCAFVNMSTAKLFLNLDDDDELMTTGEKDDSLIFDSSSFNHQLPADHDDSGIINRSDDSIDSIDEGDSKYLASETMQGKFTKAADIFSLGITIFEVASGLELPKHGKVYHKLRHNEIEDLYFNGLSADLVKIIKMMMEEDYTKRPTIDDLLHLEMIHSQSMRRQTHIKLPS